MAGGCGVPSSRCSLRHAASRPASRGEAVEEKRKMYKRTHLLAGAFHGMPALRLSLWHCPASAHQAGQRWGVLGGLSLSCHSFAK